MWWYSPISIIAGLALWNSEKLLILLCQGHCQVSIMRLNTCPLFFSQMERGSTVPEYACAFGFITFISTILNGISLILISWKMTYLKLSLRGLLSVAFPVIKLGKKISLHLLKSHVLWTSLVILNPFDSSLQLFMYILWFHNTMRFWRIKAVPYFYTLSIIQPTSSCQGLVSISCGSKHFEQVCKWHGSKIVEVMLL